MSDVTRTNMAEMSYKDLQNELIEALKERNDLAAQLTEALKPKVCRWVLWDSYDGWFTGCGGRAVKRSDNNGNHCQHCGGKIEV